MPTGTEDNKDPVADLRTAVARAKERFTALQDAFNAMENAHKQGNYSPSADLQRCLDEFRSAAADVQRLAAESRSRPGSTPDAGRTE